jgi:hypothetical protein
MGFPFFYRGSTNLANDCLKVLQIAIYKCVKVDRWQIVDRWQHCRCSSSKVGGWERAARKNRAAAQGKFSYGVERPPLSWLSYMVRVIAEP